MKTSLLSLKGITKRFPGVVANDFVSFEVQPGEIHCLLGENGAGKSTLAKIIYGVIQPDEGEMLIHGAHFHPSRPSEARAQGVGMGFQHFSLFEALSVAENVALGMNADAVEDDIGGRIVDISNAYGLPLDPTRLVGDLSVGARQRVEVVRCLLQNPRLLIMDEPTSVLTPQEVAILFETLRQLSSEGCAILYISHKLEEIRSLCQAATVIRGGKIVGSCDPREETAKSLAEMMIGQTLQVAKTVKQTPGEVRLEISGLTLETEDPFGVDITEASLTLRAGEVLGVAGVAGNGQNRLLRGLIGEHPANRPDAIRIDGKPIGHLGPTARRKSGMCFVPEERLGHGGAPDMTLWENALMTARTRLGFEKNGFLNNRRAQDFAKKVVKTFDVRTAGVNHAAKSLSGGNLQKFIVGREILQNPKVLIVSQPTWGVDAGAAALIHQAILDLAQAGTAIMVISQDLDELMALSTTFSVIAGGRLSPPVPASEISIEKIGMLMGGHDAADTPEATHA